MSFHPAYSNLLHHNRFETRLLEAEKMLQNCECCGWMCRVDRTANKVGVCKTGSNPKISNYGPHLGEENPLRGWQGSGTVFFTRCNLHCQFCQNADISQADTGFEIDEFGLSEIFIELQRIGCHNINLVSPTHVAPQLIKAIFLAAKNGLSLPIVYNTGGYDSLQALALLDGIVDIYMPDMKFADERIAYKYSRIFNYPSVNQAAVKEMYRQVGDLVLDKNGIAVQGLLVRHLILPEGLAGSEKIFKFLSEEISKTTYINIMDQYRPTYRASKHEKINRKIRPDEFEYAVQLALDFGLHRIDHRQ